MSSMKYTIKHSERHLIYISEGDFDTVKIFANKKGVTAEHIIHETVSVAAKCWVEEHATRLEVAEDTARLARKQSLELIEQNGQLRRQVKLLTAMQRHQS